MKVLKGKSAETEKNGQKAPPAGTVLLHSRHPRCDNERWESAELSSLNLGEVS